MYDNRNVIKRSFITELNKFFINLRLSKLFWRKKSNQPAHIISANNRLEFFLEENKTKDSLDLQLTKVDGTFPEITDKKIHEFSVAQIGKKRKMELIHTIIVRSQQDIEFHDQLNPTEIKITNDTFINRLKKYKRVMYKYTPVSLLFPATIQNHKNQIFVTCRELNKAKTGLINGKILNILGAINLDKINSWEKIKGKSIWVNANFEELKNKKLDHFCFVFITINLADLLFFSIYLIDNENNKITFNDTKKNQHTKF